MPYAELRPYPGMTLREARDWLRQHAAEGAKCPCCTQLTKMYRRPIHAAMAHKLIQFYFAYGTEWGLRTNLFRGAADAHDAGGDFAKLRYWGLIEESLEERQDGGRAGWWRITQRGVDFVMLRATVPKYAVVYDGRCMRTEGQRITIDTALGKRFNYNELMGRAL